jgi:hypothetical protein
MKETLARDSFVSGFVMRQLHPKTIFIFWLSFPEIFSVCGILCLKSGAEIDRELVKSNAALHVPPAF